MYYMNGLTCYKIKGTPAASKRFAKSGAVRPQEVLSDL